MVAVIADGRNGDTTETRADLQRDAHRCRPACDDGCL